MAQALAGPVLERRRRRAVRQAYGLDQPLALQYLDWAGPGRCTAISAPRSSQGEGRSLIAERLPVTMTLGLCASSSPSIVPSRLGVSPRCGELRDRPAGAAASVTGGAAELLVRPHADGGVRRRER